ncbi:MAG: methionyl-tRNA formyltransferase [Armatimonadetes bacterium]|nr:methionyl-tRNA formyltransferase [Armatimonadota bacterium]
MKLVYFGSSQFAVPALRVLASDIALVVSQPARPSGRGLKLHPTPVAEAAAEMGLAVVTPDRCRDPQFVSKLKTVEADAFIVASYGQILPKKVLDLPRAGCFNLHASLLPKYRGAAPIQYALLNGEDVTGVTLMLMDERMDTGGVIAEEAIGIGREETAGQLHDRLAALAAQLVKTWIVPLAAGDFEATPQDETKASYAKKLEKSDAQLNPVNSAQDEFNRYRACTPAPGAFLMTGSGPLKVLQASLSPDEAGPPGTVVSIKPNMVVAFGKGALELIQVQPSGRGRMTGTDYANGAHLKPGERLL